MIRIPFSTPMMQALRSGHKTQTRRVSPPRFNVGDMVGVIETHRISYGAPTMMEVISGGRSDRLHLTYRVDRVVVANTDPVEIARLRDTMTVQRRQWRPPTFLPDWAVRTRIHITKIEEQRLGDITEADAIAEGFPNRAAFLDYFGTLHPGPVDLALPVWAIHFEVLQ